MLQPPSAEVGAAPESHELPGQLPLFDDLDDDMAGHAARAMRRGDRVFRNVHGDLLIVPRSRA